MKKNVLVGQSGGPTAVINASLYGVVTESLKHDEEIDTVYGMVNESRDSWPIITWICPILLEAGNWSF